MLDKTKKASQASDGEERDQLISNWNEADRKIASLVEFLVDTPCDAFELISGQTLSGSDGNRTVAALALVIPGASSKAIKGIKYATGYGIDSYKNLKKLTKGTGLEVHHLVEKRFASKLKMNPNNMKSIVVDPKSHQGITNTFRKAIPYGSGTEGASKGLIESTYKSIYKDNPEILKELSKGISK